MANGDYGYFGKGDTGYQQLFRDVGERQEERFRLSASVSCRGCVWEENTV